MDNCTDSKMSVNAQSVEWQPKVVLDRDVVDKKLKEQARQKRRAAKSELTLRCRHCEKKFRNLSDVAEHAHQHVSQLICCIVCHKKFANLKSARKHLVVDKHYTPDPCVICGLETATKSEMTAHAAQHIKNNVGYYCFCCGFKFENQSELSKHRKEQWEKAAYDCSTCGMRFKSETRLNTHQDSHKKHICQFCKSTWYSKGSLDAHLFISHQYVDSANSATSSTMISMPLEKKQTMEDNYIQYMSHLWKKVHQVNAINKTPIKGYNYETFSIVASKLQWIQYGSEIPNKAAN